MDQIITEERLKYLRLLAEKYSSAEALYTDISRLGAQLSLPMGTEHFVSDIHGEYEAFCHLMNNCSGVIREKVRLWLGDDVKDEEEDAFCTLIYYPETILRQMRHRNDISNEWYHVQTRRMILLARMLSSKYTREKVRGMMPEEWAFLMDELMHYQSDEGAAYTEQEDNRRRYHEAIIESLIKTSGIDSFLAALAGLIKNLAVDRLHVVGDIFDRGPRADSIMELLMHRRSVDIEWGNHDVLWMGAASGSECCIAAVLRNCLSYGNTTILERGYGIPLRELALFAGRTYPRLPPDQAAAHAVTVIMFKLEGQLILRNPDFQMEDRLFLDKIDTHNGQIEIDGREQRLRMLPLPTVDPEDPWKLSAEEEAIMSRLQHAFRHSARLRQHIEFLYQRGRIYRIFNGNLLFHGCVPLNPDGSFLEKRFGSSVYRGKALMDYADRMARRAFHEGDREALDFMWYLWCGTDSPVCGRQIRTFARVFVPDEETWKEPRNAYYDWYNDQDKCREILAEFGLTDETSCIINGHTPIRVSHGESPLKAGGRLIVIDGGFCRAYQKTTGIAGYTLIANSHGMRLMSHQPFTTLRDAQESGADIHSHSYEFSKYPQRKYVRDTDHGRRLQERMDDLAQLLEAIRSGLISLEK